jgi:hypothetical protein
MSFCCTATGPGLAGFLFHCLKIGYNWHIDRSTRGELAMGDVGKRDKGNREERKKSKLTQKEKRKQKKEKQKNKSTTNSMPFPS